MPFLYLSPYFFNHNFSHVAYNYYPRIKVYLLAAGVVLVSSSVELVNDLTC